MYIVRLNKEKITILNCNCDTVTRAFIKGLLRGSDLYVDLIEYKPRTMEKSLSIVFAQARYKEDERWVTCVRATNQKNGYAEKPDLRNGDRNHPCYAPYNRASLLKHKTNQTNVVRAEARPNPPKYDITIFSNALLWELENLSHKVHRPGKLRLYPKKRDPIK